jgi:hypothetical protein
MRRHRIIFQKKRIAESVPDKIISSNTGILKEQYICFKNTRKNCRNSK